MKGKRTLIVGSVVAFLSLLTFIFDMWAEHRIEELLKKEVAQASAGAYNVEVGRVRVSSLRGAVWLKGVSLKQGRQPVLSVRTAVFRGVRFRLDLDKGLNGLFRHFAAEDIRYVLAKGEQILEAESIRVRSRDEHLEIENITLTPQYQKYQLKSDAGYSDWIQAKVEQFMCNGLDLSRFNSDTLIRIENALIRNAEILSQKNRNLQDNPNERRLFVEIMQSLPFRLDVQRIALADLNVSYEELRQGRSKPGRITFDHLEGTLFGLSNIPSPGTKYKADIHCKVMDEADLQLTFHLPVGPDDQVFRIEGHIGEMPLSVINPMLEPLADAKVETGQMTSMHFDIEGNPAYTETTLRMLYNDLSVSYVPSDPENPRTDIRFVVNPDNPDQNGVRSVTRGAERNPQRSQFSFLWKSMFFGILDTVQFRWIED